MSFNTFNRWLDTSETPDLNRFNFNHLRGDRDWQAPCPIRGMVKKFRVEFEDITQTHPLALTPATSSSRPFVELQQSFPSQVEAIEPFVEQLMLFISKFRDLDGGENNIEMALHEALANAVLHGNGENLEKRVYVGCRCDIDGEISITVRDQGQGFDTRSIPDPTAPENLMLPHGRGIYLMQTLMDEVHFDEGGVVVRMRKKPNAESATTADHHSQTRRNQE